MRLSLPLLLCALLAAPDVQCLFVDNHRNIMSGAEIEYKVTADVGGWKDEIAEVTCTYGTGGHSFTINIEGEEEAEGHHKCEFNTDPVPMADADGQEAMYATVHALAQHLKDKKLTAFAKAGCTVTVQNPDAADALKMETGDPYSVQVGVGLPIGMFHSTVINEFNDGHSLEAARKLLGGLPITRAVPKAKLWHDKSTAGDMGRGFRNWLCNDRDAFKALGGKTAAMSKDQHPVNIKIKVNEFTDKHSTDACRILRKGWSNNGCDVGRGFSGNNFPCFAVGAKQQTVGFVAELRGANKFGRYNACVSAYINGGDKPTFDTCYTNFKTAVSAIWDKADAIP